MNLNLNLNLNLNPNIRPTLLRLTTLALLLTAQMSVQMALAQTPPRWVETSLEQVPSYISAKANLKDALTKLDHLESDTLATALERKVAKVELAAAEASLVATRLGTRKALVQGYFTWLEASDTLELAGLAHTLAQGNLKAAQARFKAGAINAIDQAKAEGDAKAAQQDFEDAQTALENTQTALKEQADALPDPKTKPEVTPKPVRAQLEANLNKHPQMLSASATLEKVKVDLSLKDNEFTAPIEITAAKNTVSSAQRAFEDTQQNIKSSFKRAWDAVASASNAIAARSSALEVSQNEYAGQKARFDKGLIPRLTLLQSQISLERAQLAVKTAQHRYAVSVLDLALAANLDLWK
jgi:outer membrane protein